jgi:MFS family permease
MVSIGAFMMTLDVTVVNISLPVISTNLRLDYATLIWTPISYLVPLTVLPLTIGRLSDIHGRKPVYVSGLAIFTLFSFLCSASSSGLQLVLFRGLQGVGAAMVVSVAAAIVTDTFPSSDRGKALGTTTMSTYIGLTAGPSIGGFLTYAFGWRSIFLVNVPLGITLVVLASSKLRNSLTVSSDHSVSGRSPGFDIAGVVLFSLSVVLTLLGLTFAEVYGWSDPLILALIVGAVICACLFILAESRKTRMARTPSAASRSATGTIDPAIQRKGALSSGNAGQRAPTEPMLDLSLFAGNRLFAAANLSALLNYASYYGVSLLSSFYLQKVVGYTPLHAGLILLVMPATMAVLSPVSGRLSDRLGSRILSSLGMSVMCAALLLLSSLPLVSVASSSQGAVASATGEIVLYLFIMGFGMGMFSAPNTSAVMGSVPKSRLGVASGTVSTMRFLGQVFSLAMIGTIIASVATNSILSEFFMGISTGTSPGISSGLFLVGMRDAFTACALVAGVGIVTSLVRGSSKGSPVSSAGDLQ